VLFVGTGMFILLISVDESRVLGFIEHAFELEVYKVLSVFRLLPRG
jgi:hypothetical protein